MAKTLIITLPDNLEQQLNAKAKLLNKTPEELILVSISQVLAEKLTTLSFEVEQIETDPLIRLIGSLHSEVTDLAENHDYYIGQALYSELIQN